MELEDYCTGIITVRNKMLYNEEFVMIKKHKKNIRNDSNYVATILIYIQQDATVHSLLYLETALHVSGGTSTHHQERIKLYLQHLAFVTPLLLPAAVV
jgi:hypothetical protein